MGFGREYGEWEWDCGWGLWSWGLGGGLAFAGIHGKGTVDVHLDGKCILEA